MCRGRGGAPGGGKEDREGETVWKFVFPSCRATSCFLGDQRWAREGLAARPRRQPRGSGEGGFFPNPRLLVWLWLNLVSAQLSTGWPRPPEVREGHKMATPQHTTRQQPLGKDKFRTRTFGLEVLASGPVPKCQGPQSACGIGHLKAKVPEPG